jgi:hypothetical protein
MGVEDRFEESQVEFATEEERRIADTAISAWQAWVEQRAACQQANYVFNQDGAVVQIVITHEVNKPADLRT